MAQTDLGRRGATSTAIPALATAALGLLLLASCARPVSVPSASASETSVSASPTATSASAVPSSTTGSASAAPTSATTGTSTPTPTRNTVTVTLVNYGVSPDGIYGSGLVTGVVESGGTCTLTARNGSTTASQSMAATSSPSATNCGRITVPVTAGDWTVVLSYSSSTSEGASDPVPVHTS